MQIRDPRAAVVQNVVVYGALEQLRESSSLKAAEQAGEVFWEAGCIVGCCLAVCMATALGSAESDGRGYEELGRLRFTMGYHSHLQIKLPLESAKRIKFVHHWPAKASLMH